MSHEKKTQAGESTSAHDAGEAGHEGGANGAANAKAGHAAANRMAGAVDDLGTFDNTNKPGPKIAGKVFNLKPGDSVRFACHENQIYGVIGVTSSSPEVKVESKLIKPMQHGDLGNTNVYQYTITMAHDAKPGTKAHLTTQAPYQSHSDAGYVFSFTADCA